MDMKKLMESLEECGMSEMPAMPAPEMDKGNPVTVNVSMNASGKEHVADLLDMMKNAGLGGAAEVKPDMMPMRMDMERLKGIMGEPSDEDPSEEIEPIEDEIEVEGDYANEPEAQYGDMSDAIPDGNDLNRKKKAYAKAQDGDNAMAVEEIKARLMAALSEKQKGGDKDGDGDEDFADVQVARMVASGMDKEKAIAKVKNKDYNK